jgi:acyl-homoserine lactone acylase PvdQ
MHEDIFAASFLLNEAKAFLTIKELHSSLAGADNLGGHTAETATATAAAWAASAAAESITAARAAIIAKPAATAAKPILLTKIVAWGKRITAAAKWIEAIFTEPVALVPSAAAPSIVTHNLLRTL